jgi:hypothetical protein
MRRCSVKYFMMTTEEYAELMDIRSGLRKHARYFYTVSALTVRLSDVLDKISRVHGKDPRDGLNECADGPHFYDPSEMPEHMDKERCRECQPEPKEPDYERVGPDEAVELALRKKEG